MFEAASYIIAGVLGAYVLLAVVLIVLAFRAIMRDRRLARRMEQLFRQQLMRDFRDMQPNRFPAPRKTGGEPK